MRETPIVAWLGTGLMGIPMATRLLRQGYQVRAWNRTPEKAAPLAGQGATVAATPAEAIRGAKLVVTMLSDYPATRSVLEGQNLSEKVVIQMATIAPEESRHLETLVQQQGGRYLEAPVLGSIPEAKAGNLIIMGGGDEALFQQWLPLLQALGKEIHWIGGVGQAAALKLALNQLIATLTVAFATSLRFVEHHGVNVRRFMTVLRQSALYAPTFDKKLPRMLSHDYSNPNFPTEHLLKDIDLFLNSASGLDPRLLDAVRRLYRKALTKHRFKDYSCVFEAVVPERDNIETR